MSTITPEERKELRADASHGQASPKDMRRVLDALEAAEKDRDIWKSCVPSHCPITGLPHHGNFRTPDGEYKPFYGGPIISYGLPYMDSDKYLSRERLDEDDMSVEDETMCLYVIEEAELGDLQDKAIKELESERDAARAQVDVLAERIAGFCGVCPASLMGTFEAGSCPRPMENCPPVIIDWSAQEAAKRGEK